MGKLKKWFVLFKFEYFRLRTVAIKFIEMLALVLSRRAQVMINQ